MKTVKHLHIEGRVQGVGYRYDMQSKAVQLGLTGWVRNRSDGSVEAVVCGPATDVDQIIAWAGHGPLLANVSRVQVTETDDPQRDDFVILSEE